MFTRNFASKMNNNVPIHPQPRLMAGDSFKKHPRQIPLKPLEITTAFIFSASSLIVLMLCCLCQWQNQLNDELAHIAHYSFKAAEFSRISSRLLQNVSKSKGTVQQTYLFSNCEAHRHWFRYRRLSGTERSFCTQLWHSRTFALSTTALWWSPIVSDCFLLHVAQI